MGYQRGMDSSGRKQQRGVSGNLLLVVVVIALIAAVGVVRASQEGRGPLNRTGQASAGQTEEADDLADAALDSIGQYWEKEFPAVYGSAFVPLRGGFQPKTPDSPPFSCGGQEETYEDVKGNAFYCADGDYIAWDASDLFPRLTSQFGPVAPAVVLAHEMGHAIQRRANVQAASVVVELQADCFAGSWLRFAQESGDDPVNVTEDALDGAVSTILTLRDQPGTPATNQQAHGLGFDRVNAFQTGYDDGAKGCAAFPNEGVVTTELPFRTVSEAQTGGNLPFSEAVKLLADQLDAFWVQQLPRVAPGTTFQRPARRPQDNGPLPECAKPGGVTGYCADTRAVLWVVPELRQEHERIGDLATGALLSEAWGAAAQSEAGLPVDGRAAGLQRDCFTGSWIAALAGDTLQQSPLSPGDVDEALATLISTSSPDGTEQDDRGGAFERTRSFRQGLLGGTCKAG